MRNLGNAHFLAVAMSTMFDLQVVCPFIVGRDAPLAALTSLLERVRGGEGHVVLISGEAGIGKSRLLSELKSRAQLSDALVLQGHCLESDQSLPFAPILDLWRNGKNTSVPEFARQFDFPASLVAQLTHRPKNVTSNPEDVALAQHQLFRSLSNAFVAAAAERPLLLIVEDVHWGDEASVEFLLHLARRIESHRVLMALSYRSDDAASALSHLLAELDRQRLASELHIQPLAAADIDALIRGIFDVGRPIRADFLELITALSDGNPFFVEEILKSLVVSGDLYVSDGVWSRTELEQLVVPRSVRDSVTRRSRLISDSARHVLELAAIAGRRFDFALLQELLEVSESDLIESIKELVAAQFVIEETTDRYVFRHALTREAIYSGLLGRERIRQHRRIYEALERRHRSGIDLQVEELSLHSFLGEVWSGSLRFGRLAGARAMANYSPRAAIEHFSRSLTASIALGGIQPADLLLERGQAYETLGDFEQARLDYEAALKTVIDAKDHEIEWRALHDLGLLWSSRDYSIAGEFMHKALMSARAVDNPIRIARSLNRVGNWHLNSGRSLESCRLHEEALEIFRALGDLQGTADTLDLLGMATIHHGNIASGYRQLEEAVGLFRAIGDRRGLVNCLVLTAMGAMPHPFMIMPLSDLGVDDALERIDEAVAIAREIGWRAGEAYALLDSAYCFGAVGEIDRALASARGSLAISIEIRHRQWEAAARFCLGALALELGYTTEAQGILRLSLALAEDIGSRYWATLSAAVLADSLILGHDLSGAERVLAPDEQGTNLALELSDPNLLRVHADLALESGEPERALAIAGMMRGQFHESDRPIPALSLLNGHILASLGRFDEALIELKDAVTQARKRRGKSLLWRALAEIGAIEQRRSHRTESEMAFDEARAVIDEIGATITVEAIPELGSGSARERFLTASYHFLPKPRRLTPLRKAKAESNGLTAREREVASLLARGYSNRSISEELIIGERTVATHVAHVLAKLDLTSRSQVAGWLAEQALHERSTTR